MTKILHLNPHPALQQLKCISQRSQVLLDQYPARLPRPARSNLAQTWTELMGVSIGGRQEKSDTHGEAQSPRCPSHLGRWPHGRGCSSGRCISCGMPWNSLDQSSINCKDGMDETHLCILVGYPTFYRRNGHILQSEEHSAVGNYASK